MSVIWDAFKQNAIDWNDTKLASIVDQKEKETRNHRNMENPTCNHCQEPIYDKSSFEQNGKTVHWKCVRTIVMERLEADDKGALEKFAEDINKTAEEFANRLGFKTYDEYHKQTYGY